MSSEEALGGARGLGITLNAFYVRMPIDGLKIIDVGYGPNACDADTIEEGTAKVAENSDRIIAEFDRIEDRVKWLEDWCSNATAQRVIELEAEVANYLNNGDIKLRERINKLEADVKFWAGAAGEATLKLTARAEAAEAKIRALEYKLIQGRTY